MTTVAFAWERFASRGYGPAAEVPHVLQGARSLPTSEDVLDHVEPLLRFALDAQVLSDAAAPFAEALLAEATAALEAQRDAWPYLAVLTKLFDARALTVDVAGLIPQESITVARGWSFAERVRFYADQQRLLESVAHAIVSRGNELRRIATLGGAHDRVHAIAALHLADCLSTDDDRALLVQTLAFVTRDGHVASLLLPLAALHRRNAGTPFDPRILAYRTAASPYLRAAAWTSVFVSEPPLVTPAVEPPDVLALGIEELQALLEAADEHDVDYVWHDGLLAGELCRAVYRADLAFGHKSEFFRRALARHREGANDSYVERSVAATAAWFYLHLHLSNHYRRETPAGPEELTVEERNAVHLLYSTMQNWITLGSDYPNNFGLWQFAMTAPALVQCPKALSRELSAPWPYEGRRSTVLGFLLRALALPHRSGDRAAAFRLVCRQLFDDFDESELLTLLEEIGALPGFPRRELASALLNEVARTASRAIYSEGQEPSEHTLVEQATSVRPNLVEAIRKLFPGIGG